MKMSITSIAVNRAIVNAPSPYENFVEGLCQWPVPTNPLLEELFYNDRTGTLTCIPCKHFITFCSASENGK